MPCIADDSHSPDPSQVPEVATSLAVHTICGLREREGGRGRGEERGGGKSDCLEVENFKTWIRAAAASLPPSPLNL